MVFLCDRNRGKVLSNRLVKYTLRRDMVRFIPLSRSLFLHFRIRSAQLQKRRISVCQIERFEQRFEFEYSSVDQIVQRQLG